MPTEEEKRFALDRFHTRLTQCFTLLIWITKIRPTVNIQGEDGAQMILLMQNSAIETSLLSYRSLNEFFRKTDDRQRQDDVVAEDYFNFISPGPFLSDPEARSLNTRVMHLTYQSSALKDIGWNVADWTFRSIPLCISFFGHLVSVLPNDHTESIRASGARTASAHLLLDTVVLAQKEGWQGTKNQNEAS